MGVDKAGKTNVLERYKTLYTPLVGLDPGKILPTVRKSAWVTPKG